MFNGVLVVDSVDVGGVHEEIGAGGLGEEDGPVVGAGAGEVAAADEDMVAEVAPDLAAAAVEVGVGVGAEGGDEEEGVEVGGVDAEAVLKVVVRTEFLGEPDPLPGGLSSSADDDEPVASVFQFPQGFGVLPEGLGGVVPGEEAAAEADGDDHGSFGFPLLCI